MTKQRYDKAEIDRLYAELAEAQKTVAFFASVIRSGECWTAECETALNEALSSPAPAVREAEQKVVEAAMHWASTPEPGKVRARVLYRRCQALAAANAGFSPKPTTVEEQC